VNRSRVYPEVVSRAAVAIATEGLAAWRRGEQAVPFGAFMAAADLAGLRPPVILALAATEFDATALRGDLHPERG